MTIRNRTDWHLHFTGSLPAEFLLQGVKLDNERDLLLSKFRAFSSTLGVGTTETGPNDHLTDENAIAFLRASLRGAFTSGGKIGFDAFIDLYAAIQRSQLAASTGPESYMYHLAAYKEILTSNIRADISEILLFTSFDDNMELLSTKMTAAIEAQSQHPDIKVKIRLTLPREAERVRRFAKAGAFSMLLPVLKSQRECRIVAGIDFSGFESMDDWSISSTLIREAVLFARQNGLGVSVHVGEDLYYVSADELLRRFELLYNLGVRWLCHGSFLWIDERLLDSNQSTVGAAGAERERTALRQRFGAENTILDICPSASLSMQVIRHANQIPVSLLKDEGFNVRIGTDNPTLFQTNLCREYGLLRLPY